MWLSEWPGKLCGCTGAAVAGMWQVHLLMFGGDTYVPADRCRWDCQHGSAVPAAPPMQRKCCYTVPRRLVCCVWRQVLVACPWLALIMCMQFHLSSCSIPNVLRVAHSTLHCTQGLNSSCEHKIRCTCKEVAPLCMTDLVSCSTHHNGNRGQFTGLDKPPQIPTHAQAHIHTSCVSSHTGQVCHTCVHY